MKTQENRLLTIPVSHYCEKARWALEWSKIPYVEEKHLQGFSNFYSQRWAKSHFVPILKTSDGMLTDSTHILQWCDTQAPETRKLWPDDADAREEVDRLENYFDEELGVAGRLWMYSQLLDDMPLLLRYSKKHGVPKHEGWLMPLFFPLIRGKIQRVLKLTPTSEADTKRILDRVFDQTAKTLAGRKFLVGNAFSAADLTFAALAAPVLIPENYGVSLPKLAELPAKMQKQVIAWREHAAGEFALRIYRDFR